MGIPIEDPDKVASPGGCGLCFPPGQTPTTLFVTVGGIGLGPFYTPIFEEPPNGTFAVPYIAACVWQKQFGNWNVLYNTAAGASTCSLTFQPVEGGIIGFNVETCGAYFVMNPVLGMEFIFTAGFALVSIQDDCPLVSLNQLAESVGLYPNDELFAEVLPKDNNEAVIRYAHKRDKTNVKILLDCS